MFKFFFSQKALTQLGTAQVDLDKFVAAHPDSFMAKLVAKGISYPNTHILPPSDSFPGLLSLVTGARLFWRTLSCIAIDCTCQRGWQVIHRLMLSCLHFS